MKIVISLIVFIFIGFLPVYAQQVNVRFDTAITAVESFGHKADYRWNGIEIEVGHEFKKDKLWTVSGFTLGYRKEGDMGYGGNFVFGRAYHKFQARHFDLIVSGSAVYGLPSTYLNRSWQEHDSFNQLSYVRFYPVRGRDVSIDPIDGTGVIYPEFTAGIRKKIFKNLALEPFLGVRFLRFGTEQSSFENEVYKEREILKMVPVLGFRMGIVF